MTRRPLRMFMLRWHGTPVEGERSPSQIVHTYSMTSAAKLFEVTNHEMFTYGHESFNEEDLAQLKLWPPGMVFIVLNRRDPNNKRRYIMKKEWKAANP